MFVLLQLIRLASAITLLAPVLVFVSAIIREHSFRFDAAALIIVLITLIQTLEHVSKRHQSPPRRRNPRRRLSAPPVA
jgi:cation transport ATPase